MRGHGRATASFARRWRLVALLALGALAPQVAAAAPVNVTRASVAYLLAQARVLPGPDVDANGVANGADDCPFVANSDQSDAGGVGTDSPANGRGDACECGDVSGDGRVTIADATLIQRSLLSPPTASIASRRGRPNP